MQFKKHCNHHTQEYVCGTTEQHLSPTTFLYISGILLIFHGMNREVPLTILLGALVLAVPTCVIIPAAFAVKHYRQKWRDKRQETRDRRKAYQYENPFQVVSELQV